MKRIIVALVLLGAAIFIVAGCGGGGGPTANVSIAISPNNPSVSPGQAILFTATVTGASNTAVNWTSTGGSLMVGSTTCTFTAPGTNGTYTVKATSVADPSKSASTQILVSDDLPPPPPPF